MKSGATADTATPARCLFVPLNSRGTPGRPKARALIKAVRVHVRCEASRTPAANLYA
jgi:hypothetical protein